VPPSAPPPAPGPAGLSPSGPGCPGNEESPAIAGLFHAPKRTRTNASDAAVARRLTNSRPAQSRGASELTRSRRHHPESSSSVKRRRATSG
jgi:hypothetical protein